jgi:hypothetical protein
MSRAYGPDGLLGMGRMPMCDGHAQGEEPVLEESKKSSDVKMRELLEGGKPSFANALTSCCVEHVSDLLRGPPAADVLVEVARGGDGGADPFVDMLAIFIC